MSMGERVIATMLQCLRCGHKWWPRKPGTIPVHCPSCNSPYWDKPVTRVGVSENRKNKI
ncbi:Uncharacterised protein [uncultured archaeon]|nr:Uncharacterised protein [uncultured archaeon]